MALVLKPIVAWEIAWWAIGKIDRQRQFRIAADAAAGGSMLVVGLPDGEYPWPAPGGTVVDLRPRPRDVPRGVRYVQASVERLPFSDGEFSSCFCSHVVEHVADPVAAVRELRRVSRTPPRICYPRPWRIATWLVPGHRWLMVEGRNGFRFRPNPLSNGSTNVPTRYGTARPTVFGDVTGDEAIRVLVRQALRWLTAARQDREPAVAVLHSDYARAAVDHLRQIAPDDEIRRVARIDPIALERATTAAQDAATARLLVRCPTLRPPGLAVEA